MAAITLFASVRRSPASSEVDSDIALMQVIAGHCSRIEYLTRGLLKMAELDQFVLTARQYVRARAEADFALRETTSNMDDHEEAHLEGCGAATDAARRMEKRFLHLNGSSNIEKVRTPSDACSRNSNNMQQNLADGQGPLYMSEEIATSDFTNVNSVANQMDMQQHLANNQEPSYVPEEIAISDFANDYSMVDTMDMVFVADLESNYFGKTIN
jgi:hypothetical protein